MEALDLIGQLLGTESSLYTWILSAIAWVSMAVGNATLIIEALEKIANVTPSHKDNEYVAKWKRKVGKVAHFIDKIAMSKRQ